MLHDQRLSPPVFSRDIRLLIWELDSVFWDGSLGDGTMAYRRAHHDLVVTLARRGIMSSICARHIPQNAQDLLTERGIWDYFIFPNVQDTPAGIRLQDTMADIGLRAEAVLYLGADKSRLAEAVALIPGLNVGLPQVIPHLETHPQLQGKSDRSLDRLAYYKVKEARAHAFRVAAVRRQNRFHQDQRA